MALRIITDSAADLNPDIIETFHVDVIPTPVVVDGVDYLDGVTIFTEEFYKLLDANQDIKTYHINPSMFEEVFRVYAQKGEKVLYLCFSTGIAGTYNAAHVAKETILEEYPEFDLTIFDSRCASAGFGLLVYKLLRLQEKGAEDDVILEAAVFYREHIRHVFTVETLHYLIKGGRLSKVSGTIGEILEIKPILTVDAQGGLTVVGKVRGRKKSLKELVGFVKKNGAQLENQILFLCHGEDMEGLSLTRSLLKEGCKAGEEVINTVGCAIGAHTGRGIIGICFLDADDKKYREYGKISSGAKGMGL